ncbi:voltage-dependent anion channel [Lipomyces tetrasporus]|uniref:Voltage-dependent anion channel n=1 Tax=Lipomyces tetrasporus TaxID=54092 RepID=A0AAD7VPI8_9ASCO|nr:voltage-dependent anion channel [Lipomyces tetrasporus]KAJ8097208.1 voltage-dependent anion channel [Lipomyces tetrasporus]
MRTCLAKRKDNVLDGSARSRDSRPIMFTVVMGCGISSSILLNYNFETFWLTRLAYAYWGVALFVFMLFIIFTVLRLVLFPGTLLRSFRHPRQSMFYGCIPTAYSSVLMDTVKIFGVQAVWPCYVLLWLDISLAFTVGWFIMFNGFVTHDRKNPTGLTGVILLPTIAVIVNSTTAALLVPYLPLPSTCGACLPNLPERENMISSFLLVGPLGQGAYSVLRNLNNVNAYYAVKYIWLAETPIFLYIGVGISMLMVAFASFWLFCAVASCLVARPRRFGITWWSLCFPMGTYALATSELGRVLDSMAFKVLSAIVGTTVVIVCFILLWCTLYFSVLHDQVFREIDKEMTDYYGQSHGCVNVTATNAEM